MQSIYGVSGVSASVGIDGVRLIFPAKMSI